MAEQAEVLCIDGQTYSTDDLSYAELREIKRIVRLELWDEEVNGEWEGWGAASTDDYIAATVLVILRRSNADATLEDALAYKPAEVVVEEEADPPTPAPTPSRRASRTPKASGGSGSPR